MTCSTEYDDPVEAVLDFPDGRGAAVNAATTVFDDVGSAAREP
jgi:hypothetical protein